VCACESECSVPPPPAWGLPSPFISQREGSYYRERDRRDRVASPLRVDPNGPVHDDGGAPIPCPGAMSIVCPNRTGGAGLSGRRTGDVRPAEMGGAFYGLTPSPADVRGVP
jgi:hypothetical protein